MDKQTFKILLNPSYLGIITADLLGFKNQAADNRQHIAALIEWLANAQDATQDGGVSLGFSLRTGWLPSYPETTGYIIPTMLDYYQLNGDENYRQRAIRMADWIISVQLECGATQSGPIGDSVKPCVFNTGQNLFGLVRAYQETQAAKYHDAAVKAGNWLVEIQDDDGAWRKDVYGQFVHVYNTRTAWGLLKLYEIAPQDFFLQAAIKNIDWAIKNKLENGWFRQNSFFPSADPLTHNIGYAARGILEAGLALKNDEYINSAKCCADALLKVQHNNGSLAATYNERWEATTAYSCLTGNAQITIIWLKLYKLTRNMAYLDAAKAANQFLKTVHRLNFNNPDIKGATKGSHPISGGYQSFSYPNWAAKFFADSLMLEDSI